MNELILGCTTVAYLKHPLERALAGIKASGLAVVELAAVPGYCMHVDPLQGSRGIGEVRETLEAYELRAVSLSGHSDLTDRDGLAYLKTCVDFAEALELSIVNTGTGPIRSSAEEDVFVTHARELARHAEMRGVTIGLETQNEALTSGSEAARLLARIGSERVGINLDAANVIYWGGQRPEDEIAWFAPHVVHMHVKDKSGGRGEYLFPPVGDGTIDFAVLFQELARVGFVGPYILEPELSQLERDEREVAEARTDPGAAYARSHGYLGEADPGVIDSELQKSCSRVESILSDAYKGAAELKRRRGGAKTKG